MKEKPNKWLLIFKGEKRFPLIWIIILFVWLSRGSIKNNIWIKYIKDIEFSTISIIVLSLLSIIILILLLFYISNRKSYIELWNNTMKIYKPKNYPFFWKMESISIPYNEIDTVNVNIVTMSMRNFSINNIRSWYNITIKLNKKDNTTKKVKFYQLSEWKNFIAELKERDINVNYRVSNSIN